MKKIIPVSKLGKSALLKKYNDLLTKYHDTCSDAGDMSQQLAHLDETLALQTKRHLEQIVKLNAEVKEWKDRFNMLLASHTKVTMTLPPAALQ